MSKNTVTRLFVGSLIALAGGIVSLLVATGIGFVGTGFTMQGPDVVGVQPTSMTWMAMTLGIVGIAAIIGGTLGQFVAWIGALLNTAQLQDKTWFVLLLVLGILSLGFVPMLVYVLVGPDGTPTAAPDVQTTATAGPADLPKAA